MEDDSHRSGRISKQTRTRTQEQIDEFAAAVLPACKKLRTNDANNRAEAEDTNASERAEHEQSTLTMATTAAAARTFAIPELLENILVQLVHFAEPAYAWNPPTILFSVQRVNTTFRSTILGSKTLPKLMLLVHDTDIDSGRADSGTEANLGPLWWLVRNIFQHRVRGFDHGTRFCESGHLFFIDLGTFSTGDNSLPLNLYGSTKLERTKCSVACLLSCRHKGKLENLRKAVSATMLLYCK